MRILQSLSITLILGICLSNIATAAQNTTATVFELMKQKKWAQCENLASSNRALKKIVLAQRFLDNNYKDNNFEEIIHFLQANPKWPQSYSLKIKAESLLNEQSDKKLIVDWFSNNNPITPSGHKYYALAAADFNKDKSIIIKNGWIFGNFAHTDQKNYYQKFKKNLSMEDTIDKIDYYLLQEQTTNAKNFLYLLNRHHQMAFNAQMALMQNAKNAISLFKQVPAQYRTAGLVYQYINSQKKTPIPAAELNSLIKSVRIPQWYAQKFWKLQSYIAREFLEKKKYRDTYDIVSNHVALCAADLSDAEFFSGWLLLSFLKKPEQAMKHFQKFNHVVKTPMSKSRGLYWLGRTYNALNQQEKAKELYSLAATKYSYSFYGQMSAIELKHTKLYLPGNFQMEKYNNHEYLKNNDIAKATVLVSKYGSKSLAEIYIKAAIEQTSTQEQVLALAAGIASNKNTYHNAWMSKYAMQKHVFIKNYAYPTPYQVSHLPIENSLTYSIVRQESVFDQQAVSSAEAMGLMQLLGPTACRTAKLIGDTCKIAHLTKDPKYNLKLGSNYLNSIIKNFQGSYILAIASYNGGPSNVKKWINLHGDPRKIKDLHKIVDWLELIPYYETRNYVQRVLENLQVYRTILNKNSPFELKKDLLTARGI